MIREKYGYQFDSWAELVDVAVNGVDLDPSLGRSSRKTDDPEWAGTPTFEDAVDLASRGWADGAERITRDAGGLFDRLTSYALRQEPAYALAGPGTLDIPRYLSGHPEPYMTWAESAEVREAVGTRGVLKVGFNIVASSGIDVEVMFRRGAALVAVIDCLERAGFRCEVDLVAAIAREMARQQYVISCRVKNAADHVEPDLLAFVAAHASSFRRIIFSVMETADLGVRKEFGILVDGGYGRPGLAFPGTDYDVTIESAEWGDDRWRNAETAAQWVKQVLAAQGVEVGEAE